MTIYRRSRTFLKFRQCWSNLLLHQRQSIISCNPKYAVPCQADHLGPAHQYFNSVSGQSASICTSYWSLCHLVPYTLSQSVEKLPSCLLLWHSAPIGQCVLLLLAKAPLQAALCSVSCNKDPAFASKRVTNATQQVRRSLV